MHDVRPISDEKFAGRRHSLGDSTDQVNRGAPMFGEGTALEGLRNTGTEACSTHAPGMRPGILTGYEPVAGEPREQEAGRQVDRGCAECGACSES